MRRRGLGLGAVQRQQKTEAKYKELSATIAKEQLEKLSQQMEVFRAKLQEFSISHKKDIRKDSNFRRAFQTMCANVGVDPLHSSSNFWTKMLGVGDIYYELAIQIVEICMALNHRTGGVMDINELHSRLIKSRKGASNANDSADISIDDITRAIEKMSVLGNGILLIKCKNTCLVQSSSNEINLDQNEAIKVAQEMNGQLSRRILMDKLNWSQTKTDKALSDLVMEGVVWVDEKGPQSEVFYWVPGLYKYVH